MTISTGRPAGTLPEPVKLSNDYGLLEVQWDATDAGLEITGRFRLRPQLLAPSDYPAFRRFLVAAQQNLTRPVEVP